MNKENDEGTYSLDDKTVAYKDGVCYPVHVSNETIACGGCIGRVRKFIIDGKLILFLPLTSFCDGYHLLYIDNIEEQRKIVNAYDKLINELPKDAPQQDLSGFCSRCWAKSKENCNVTCGQYKIKF